MILNGTTQRLRVVTTGATVTVKLTGYYTDRDTTVPTAVTVADVPIGIAVAAAGTDNFAGATANANVNRRFRELSVLNDPAGGTITAKIEYYDGSTAYARTQVCTLLVGESLVSQDGVTWLQKDANGYIKDAVITTDVLNVATTDQVISAATAYVAGSNIAVPAGKLKIGSIMRWRLAITKSGAGTTAGCAILVKLGTAGTTGDATVLTFTFGTPTAVADTAVFDVEVVCRGPLTGSGILQGFARMTHNLQATGFSTLAGEAIAVTSGNVDVTVANLIAGLTITTTTASAWTVKLVDSQLTGL